MRLNRDDFALLPKSLPSTNVVMEACTTSALADKIARIAWAIWRHDRPINGSLLDGCMPTPPTTFLHAALSDVALPATGRTGSAG